jgi:hypothetical protein
MKTWRALLGVDVSEHSPPAPRRDQTSACRPESKLARIDNCCSSHQVRINRVSETRRDSEDRDPRDEVELARLRPEDRRETTRQVKYSAVGSGFALLVSLGAALIPIAIGAGLLLNGSQLLIAFGLLALVILIFLAFVFERLLKIKAEVSKTWRLEVEAGDKAR